MNAALEEELATKVLISEIKNNMTAIALALCINQGANNILLMNEDVINKPTKASKGKSKVPILYKVILIG